jgi:hypothetical protein
MRVTISGGTSNAEKCETVLGTLIAKKVAEIPSNLKPLKDGSDDL